MKVLDTRGPFSGLVHRNVLVGEELSCVVGDFGMSRALAKDDSYYHMSTTNRLPVKWMALEAIEYKKYSTYSDGEPCACVSVCLCVRTRVVSVYV